MGLRVPGAPAAHTGLGDAATFCSCLNRLAATGGPPALDHRRLGKGGARLPLRTAIARTHVGVRMLVATCLEPVTHKSTY